MQKYTCFVFVMLFLKAGYVYGATKPVAEDSKAVVNLVFENDVFADQDGGYTDGIRLSALTSETGTPQWVRSAANNFLPIRKEGSKRISVALGQSIYTPHDIETREPLLDDQPYAGWLYGSLGIVSDTGKILENVVLTLGVVGPSSYAEVTQKAVHHMIGSPHPEGWDNQLHNEPGVIFTYERKWRNIIEVSPYGMAMDATPDIGMMLGNVNTSGSVGATFRLGIDLPADYGPPRIRPSLPGSDFFVPTQTLGGYLLAGVEARAVARNIFLDGNTFGSSQHVDKELLIADMQLGASMTYKNSRLSYTHVLMTKEFETQQKAPQFGALTLSYRF